jgi:hypothetical protein
MSGDTFEVNFESFFKFADHTKAEVKASAVIGVHDAMDHLLAVSREEAPLDKGTLRTTAFTNVSFDGSTLTGEVVYSATEEDGKGRYNYALIMHEMGRYKDPTTPGTRPKFLERPLKLNATRYHRMITDAVREGLS